MPGDVSMLSSSQVLADEIASRVPGLWDAFDSIGVALRVWFPTTNTAFGHAQAQHVTSSLASNDLLDLLTELLSGRGRPAARSMRNLFEHLITMLDVTSDSATGERFLAHRPLVRQVEAELEFEWRALSGNERKAEQHRLRKLARDTKAEADAAVQLYGRGFSRRWAALSLRDRAAVHGYDPDYAVYQLTSAVLHGSAGGALGTVQRNANDDDDVHRLGPALALCPLSYLRGLTYYRATVQRLVDHNGRRDVFERAEPLLVAIDEALALWPSYRREVRGLDKKLWESALPITSLLSVLVFDRAGFTSWYLWDLNNSMVCPAQPPRDSEVDRLVRICRSNLKNFTASYWTQRLYVTVVMTDLALAPVGRTWASSSSIIAAEVPEATSDSRDPFVVIPKALPPSTGHGAARWSS